MIGDPLYAALDRTAVPVGATAEQWDRYLRILAAAKPTLCVDFDGTMTLAGPYEPGVPSIGVQPGTRRALAEWVAEGYRIVVLTARNTADVWPWLAGHGLTQFVDEVTNTKPPAVAYIDDRAVSFGGDWDAVRAKVRTLADRPAAPPSDDVSRETDLSGHGRVACSCGATIRNCRCPSEAHPGLVETIERGCAACLAAAAEPTPHAVAHVRVHGLDVAIENEPGSIRRSKHTKPDGSPEWETRMAYRYGEIGHTEGADGDAIDVFLTPDPEGSDRVFVINQIDPATRRFDEHKCVLGARSLDEARAVYLANYDATGPQRIGSIREMPLDEFKRWAFGGPRRIEAASYFETCEHAPAGGDGHPGAIPDSDRVPDRE
jgi:hypothetical protein